MPEIEELRSATPGRFVARDIVRLRDDWESIPVQEKDMDSRWTRESGIALGKRYVVVRVIYDSVTPGIKVDGCQRGVSFWMNPNHFVLAEVTDA